MGVEGFWVAELRVWQLKIGSKSCFGNYETLKHKPSAIVISVRRLFIEMRMSTEDLATLRIVNFFDQTFRLIPMKIW